MQSRGRGPLDLGLSMLFLLVVSTTLAAFATADDVIVPNSLSAEEAERFSAPEPRRKKPFCNAFTGCGRKRSVWPPIMASLVDPNPEPAVEDLNRQILMLEAIQEVRDEIMRQHDKAMQAGQLVSSRQVRPYRKRRSVDPSDFDRRFAADTAGRLRFL